MVIDASIARACGQPEAIYPTSVHCREFLENVLLTCHHMVMTREIRDEWNKHASKFAQAWKVEMVSRKKVVAHNTESLDRSLWDALENFAKTDGQRGEIVKDIHLLEAALATDQIIVSLDENTARKYFTQAARRIEALKPIGLFWDDGVSGIVGHI